MRHLSARGLIERGNESLGFGRCEMDEPESKGAIGLAGRESWENLIFVINCNLQRLDGLRGNHKIIQSYENQVLVECIKSSWGYWDQILSRDGEANPKDYDAVVDAYNFKAMELIIRPTS